ncbi:hypothetical protein TNCV_3678751 [Trichonephila clavipes]|nr:hypothetical protein TNCV_3678751 [Trichonephila clavipes]
MWFDIVSLEFRVGCTVQQGQNNRLHNVCDVEVHCQTANKVYQRGTRARNYLLLKVWVDTDPPAPSGNSIWMTHTMEKGSRIVNWRRSQSLCLKCTCNLISECYTLSAVLHDSLKAPRSTCCRVLWNPRCRPSGNKSSGK